MLFPETFLDRVQLTVLGDPLNRGHRRPICLDGEEGARLDGLAVDENRARATLRRIAANVGTGQVQDVAQVVNEEGTGLYVIAVRFTVDGDANFTH